MPAHNERENLEWLLPHVAHHPLTLHRGTASLPPGLGCRSLTTFAVQSSAVGFHVSPHSSWSLPTQLPRCERGAGSACSTRLGSAWSSQRRCCSPRIVRERSSCDGGALNATSGKQVATPYAGGSH